MVQAIISWVRRQKARRAGLEAGYHGQGKCLPNNLELAQEYAAGYAEGESNRQFDLASGTHPDLEELPRHQRRMA